MFKNSVQKALFMCIMTGLFVCLSAQNISGVARLVLNSPATQQDRQRIKGLAMDSLKTSIIEWMKETHRQVPDSSQTVEWHHFMSFVTVCAQSAEKQSFVEQKEWTLRLDLTHDKMVSVLNEHNSKTKPLAIKYWELAQEGLKHNRASVVFTSSVHTLYHSLGYLGEPLFLERGSELVDLKEESLKTLQDALDGLEIRYSSFIIKGKPGNSPDEEVTITATIDSTPLPGLPFTGALPGGDVLFRITTLLDGTTPLGDFTIPFVSYGTFLHVQPNLGAIVQPSLLFNLDDFGLIPGEGQNQTLMFNIIKQAYTLDYNVSGVSQVAVPAGFRSGDLVRKFLKDSCNLVSSSATNPSDLRISVEMQVSSYTYDSREETEMKAEALIRIKQLHSRGTKVEKTLVLNQKTFDSNHEIPTGLFFWETTYSLRNRLRDMLNSL